MSDLLLSFCNRERSASEGLLSYDLAAGAGRWIPIGDEAVAIRGTRGTAVATDRIYVLYNVEWRETLLCTLDARTYEILENRVLPEVSDPHSLCVERDRLLIASTGTDSVVAYALRDGAVEGAGETLWRASDRDEDTQHVNSVIVHRGDLLISAFGEKTGQWRDSRDGYVYNVTAERMERTGIWHPHSLCATGDDVYFAESARQRLRSLGGVNVTIGAYARAIAALDDRTLLVGTNVARLTSVTTGVVYNDHLADGSLVAKGNCSLASVTLGGEVPLRRYHDLSGFGREIYDVVVR